MRVLRILSLLAMLALITPGAVSAATLTASGQLHVKAEVLPVRSIVVDHSGRIVQIYSNTTEPTDNIKVYLRSPTAANAIPLTDTVFQQYLQLLSVNQGGIGKIYDRSSLGKLLTAPAASPLSDRQSQLI